MVEALTIAIAAELFHHHLGRPHEVLPVARQVATSGADAIWVHRPAGGPIITSNEKPASTAVHLPLADLRRRLVPVKRKNMSKILNKLLGKSSSTDIAAAIEKAKAELEAAEAAVTAAEEQYDANLLSADKKSLRGFLDAKTEAGIDVDQARARIHRLERDHEIALETEAADQRQQQYDEARAASEAAEKRLRREYPKAALQIRELLAEVAAASLAVREANADRPEDTQVLLDPEHSRSQHHLYREVLSEDIADLWTEIDGTSPIREDLQRNVRAHEKRRRGMMTDRSDSDENPLQYGTAQTEQGPLEVVRKRFRRTKFLPDQTGRHIGLLAGEIVLPALDAGATPFWVPAYDQRDAAAQAAAELKPAPKRAERTPEYSYSLAPKETADVE